MNLQGGDNNIHRNFYKLTFGYIRNNDKLLNFGCGTKFNFEKALTKVKQVKIVSCDIINDLKKPDFIAEYINKSVEEKIDLNTKFDVVSFFEVIEHIDKTDMLLKNCYNNLKDDGILIFSFPNLASIYSRIELLLGFQPHILEISNKRANFGSGIFGRLNNPLDQPIHHIRGITNGAMKEMLKFNGFKVIKNFGYEYRFKKLFYFFPNIASVNIFICKKNI